MTIFERFRKHMDWTQVRLAEELGVSKQLINLWERDPARRPRPDDAHRFIALAARHDFTATLEDVYPAPETTA